MACKWTDLFTVGEEFDDEDLLQADWTLPSAPATALQSANPQGASASDACKQAIAATSITTQNNESDPGRQATHNVPGQPSVLGLRGFCAPKLPSTSCAGPSISLPDKRNSIQPSGSPSQNSASGARVLDDFDDWDVDLTDLDDNVSQMVPVPHVGQSAPATHLAPPTANSDWPCEDSISPPKRMRPSVYAASLTPPGPSLRGFSIAAHTPESLPPPLDRAPTPRRSFATPGPGPCLGPFRSPAVLPAPPRSPVHPRMASSFSLPSPVTPRLGRPQPQGQMGTGMRQPAAHVTGGLFQAVSPRPQPTPSSRSLHTPVLTNHLVQLVSASKKTPQRSRPDPARPKTRRFPGPAGMLPQQLSGKNLDDIVVSVPQTPAHGAVARLRSEVPSSQAPDEEDFSGGAWAAMKAEMGLDEKNPSCFLHSYSVVMVLRKAALKQLNKNKVPNMAVVLKSILHTHADAKAVFKDPTGEMQGTVHRRLLEDRQAELKTGAVLLLKQVGVFSPSHRNHYLNVTPNNLLRIYPPDGILQPCAALLSQHAPGPLELWNEDSTRAVGGPVSQMELRFEDEEEEEESGQKKSRRQEDPPEAAAHNNGPSLTNEAAWDTDGLDELLGELPVETYSV